MRGVMIVNPNATTTDARIRDVLVAALSSVIDLQAITTTHRGHAGELARAAAHDGTEVLVTLGGDGTVHEVVNGLMNSGSRSLPALATIPGGSANVFARACGLPNDPVQATGAILGALRLGRFRQIGLGRANGLWFTCNAGLGMDAEVIAAMEAQRGRGHKATPTRYVATALRQYFTGTDRRRPALTVLPSDRPAVGHVFLGIVQNCAPWTYMGGVPVNACPQASFDTGLDLFAVRDLGVVASLQVTGRILRSSSAPARSGGLYVGHDLAEFAVAASRDVAFQVDGEGLAPTRHVRFESVPKALRIVDAGTDPSPR
jgi:diacylglycerol kinase family enzyme